MLQNNTDRIVTDNIHVCRLNFANKILELIILLIFTWFTSQPVVFALTNAWSNLFKHMTVDCLWTPYPVNSMVQHSHLSPCHFHPQMNFDKLIVYPACPNDKLVMGWGFQLLCVMKLNSSLSINIWYNLFQYDLVWDINTRSHSSI